MACKHVGDEAQLPTPLRQPWHNRPVVIPAIFPKDLEIWGKNLPRKFAN